MTTFRDEEKSSLQAIFLKFDGNGSGGLSLGEAQLSLSECGLHPRSQEEAMDINNMIEEFDEDGSGEVDFDEFVHLVAFVSKKVEALRQEAERQIAAVCS